MGKEWLHWGTSKSNKKGGGRTAGEGEQVPPPVGCMSAVFQIFDLPSYFQLAPLNQLSPSLTKQEQDLVVLKEIEGPRNSLDLEELEPVHVEQKSAASSSLMSSSAMNLVEKNNLYIPVGIQIRTGIDSKSPRVSTSTSGGKMDDISSECSSSPGIKTPTLVARLMGLDLLPENNTPPLSNVSTFKNNPRPMSHINPLTSHLRSKNHFSITGTVSLPETPRGSADSRRSDVDHHRLSLQISKENIGDKFEFSACNAKKMARRRGDDKLREEDEENRSPGYYARQIVKQVKERVSRKVGLDITNTATSKDNHVVLLRPTKQSKVLTRLGDNNSQISKQSTPSCSPKLRFLEPKNKAVTTSIDNKTQTLYSPRLSPLSPSPDYHSLPTKIITKSNSQDSSEVKQNQVHQRTLQQGKGPIKGESVQYSHEFIHTKSSNERPGENCNSRLKRPRKGSDAIRSKKEEQFVHSAATNNRANLMDKKKCKRTALSNLNTNVPTSFPLKKDPSPPPIKLLIKQSQESDTHPSKRSTQLSCCSSHSYKNTLITIPENRSTHDRCNGTTTTCDGEEFQYIQRIMKRTGIDKGTPVSLAKWYSKLHPLDPSIFHHFELFHYSIFFTPKSNNLSLRCNRKLIFQLVDELLVEILEPYINLNPWTRRLHCQMHGSELVEKVCTRIQSFPSANCQVLEDIDALINKDLQNTELGTSGAFEEGESIQLEIERDIFESLVHESVTVFGVARIYV